MNNWHKNGNNNSMVSIIVACSKLGPHCCNCSSSISLPASMFTLTSWWKLHNTQTCTCMEGIYTTSKIFFLLSNQSMNNLLLYLLWPTKDRSSASSKFLAVFCNLRGQIPKVSKEQSTCMCKRHILSNRSSRVACVRCLVKCMLEIGNLQNNQFNLYLWLCSDEGLMIKTWKLSAVANLDYQVSW